MQDVISLAAELWAGARADGQCARRVESDDDADRVRQLVREHARAADVRIRTARMDGTVVAVRLDAALWHESTATMREKLTPPPL